MSIVVKPTTPLEGQKPGTSGLRKPTKTFMKPNYTENFIQAILNTLQDRIKQGGATLVLGGDGRFYSHDALVNIIIPMCAANGVAKVIVGHNGILSTPAVSHVIRLHGADGGILLTASHNPGGIDHDFGIKFNVANGGPAPEKVTDDIYKHTLGIKEYKTLDGINVSLEHLGTSTFKVQGHDFVVEMVDSVDAYLEFMKQIFDFQAIRTMITGADGQRPFNMVANALSGVMGPYVKRILCRELGMPESNAIKCVPLGDFGGGHPDPNLTYAADLVQQMVTGDYDFGCAFDGDGDRNMILGAKGFFVCPCDSLAVIADNVDCIPYFAHKGVKGFARSMPTSGAVDLVAKQKGVEMFEVPTGWKFFGNLMDAGRLSLCGEESFGTGSDHIREKDGLWAVLSWLSILAHRRSCKGGEHKAGGVADILLAHWQKYGRNFYTRYDYENCTSEQGDQIMKVLENYANQPSTVGKEFKAKDKCYQVAICDNFCYRDPVDNSISSNQGIRFVFKDGSRLVFRLSGTGSSGATVRIYVDSYETDSSKHSLSSAVVLEPLVTIALEICEIRKIAGRDKPTVIT